MNLLLSDLDGTLRIPITGEFVNFPSNQKLKSGIRKKLRLYKEQGYKIVVCSNQGGIKAGYKTLNSTFKEMIVFLKMCPEVDKIYFSLDDYECWCIQKYLWFFKKTRYASNLGDKYNGYFFRKPNIGMLELAIDNNLEIDKIIFVGDGEEDKQAAINAEIDFVLAEKF